jgi:hypothetical protein
VWGPQILPSVQAVIRRPHDAFVTYNHYRPHLYIQKYDHTLAKQKEHHLHKNFVIAWGATKTHHWNSRSKPTMTLSSQTAIFFQLSVQTSCMVIWEYITHEPSKTSFLSVRDHWHGRCEPSWLQIVELHTGCDVSVHCVTYDISQLQSCMCAKISATNRAKITCFWLQVYGEIWFYTDANRAVQKTVVRPLYRGLRGIATTVAIWE